MFLANSSASGPLEASNIRYPLLPEDAQRQTADLRLVFRHQYGFRAALDFSRRGKIPDRVPRRRPRQINVESGALAHAALDVDPAAALPHDPVDGGKTQPCTDTLAFCGEERLENTAQNLALIPIAGVADGKHYVRARIPSL